MKKKVVTVTITEETISHIKSLVNTPLRAGQVILLISSLFNINLLNIACTKEHIHLFSTLLKKGTFTVSQLRELFKSCIEGEIVEVEPMVEADTPKLLTKVEVSEKEVKFKTKKVTQLKAGDIILVPSLSHPFLILTISRDGIFKSVGLSSKPDPKQTLAITSRFLQQESYVRLTVSVHNVDDYKSKWVGSITQSQLKLVKQFLKSNKLI